ncbi:MAG: DUF2268 domain-containing putative Zn-dependent protease [Robiginitalea sp.]|uniref:gliding motility protein GldB-related protein n=1 Tax=Robiginitalea sp. TaxID=1902411 RepID=UPI003C789BFE
MKLRHTACVLSLGILTLGISCGTPEKKVSDMRLPNMERLFNFYGDKQAAGDFKALADSLVRANEDLQSSELFVQAAYVYWEGGETDSAIAVLHKAIDQGMCNPRILEKFPKRTNELKGEGLAALQERLDSIDMELKKLSHFELRTEAMDAFWPYLNTALQDTSQARQQLKTFVLKGPPEVRDFYVVRYGSIDQMYGQIINAAPEYYRYLEEQFSPDSVNLVKETIVGSMTRFREIYPQAVFPKVYIVPGILNSGGTATEMGMFLGGDMYGKSPKMPTQELTDWQRDAIMNFSDLPRLTIHELMHFQQNYQDQQHRETVLSAIVHEGVCDFMVELCSGEVLVNDNLEFLSIAENEKWIFEELATELLEEDASKWLYNGGSIEDRPADLGYTVGYLITKSYYEQHPDKKQAVYDLLNSNDLTEIVKNSSYAYLLERSQAQTSQNLSL